MLDENKEYEQYTSNYFDTNIKPRLKYETFISKDCAGMPRALLIIARHYMHNIKDIHHCETAQKKDVINDCNNLLRAWMGFEYNESNQFHKKRRYPPVQYWLPNYITKIYLEPKIKECANLNNNIGECLKNILNNVNKHLSNKQNIAKIEHIVHESKNNQLVQLLKILNVYESLQNKRGYIGQGIYASRYQGGVNKNKITRLSDIIAEAYNAGKLKTRYLIFANNQKEQPFDYIYKEKNDEYKILKVDSQRDFILKMTALYLVALEQYNENTTMKMPISYVPINKQDMINWLAATKFPNTKNKNDGKDIFYFSDDGENFEPLFKFQTHVNEVKFSMCNKWVDKFNISEKKPTKIGRIFFEDAGASEFLVKKVVK